jgi:hypothetical protein
MDADKEFNRECTRMDTNMKKGHRRACGSLSGRVAAENPTRRDQSAKIKQIENASGSTGTSFASIRVDSRLILGFVRHLRPSAVCLALC